MASILDIASAKVLNVANGGSKLCYVVQVMDLFGGVTIRARVQSKREGLVVSEYME